MNKIKTAIITIGICMLGIKFSSDVQSFFIGYFAGGLGLLIGIVSFLQEND